LLIGSSSQVLVTDADWPLNEKDSSQIDVGKNLNFVGGDDSSHPCLLFARVKQASLL
jgi:hypothetical protein